MSKLYGPIAQWLEQSSHKTLVSGSSPDRPTNLSSNNTTMIVEENK
jgi:hypothetical protein